METPYFENPIWLLLLHCT